MRKLNEENILKQAGLSEEQAITYEALLEKGPQKATPLSSWTGIKRGLIYKVLEQLENMGLVEKKEGAGTVAVFYPNHPSGLLDKIERDRKNLELAKEMVDYGMGTLSSKYKLLDGKPSIRFFEGLDGVKYVHKEMIKNAKEVMLIQSPKDRESQETSILIDENIKSRIKKGLITRAITPLSTTTKSKILSDKERLVERRIIDDNIFNIEAQIVIFNDIVSIMDYKKNEIITTIIDNPAIAKTFKAIFEFMWLSLKTEQEKFSTKIKP